MAEIQEINITIPYKSAQRFGGSIADASGNVYDLTAGGNDARFDIGLEYGEASIVSLTVSGSALTGQSNGQWVGTLSTTNWDELEVKTYYHTVWRKDSGNWVAVANGKIEIDGTVSPAS